MLKTLENNDLVLFSNGDEAIVVDYLKRSDGRCNIYFNKCVYGWYDLKDDLWVYNEDDSFMTERENEHGVDIVKVIHATRQSE